MASMRTIGERLRTALRALFGELTWQRPGWFTNTSTAARRGSASLATAVRGDPRRSALAGVAGLALLIGAVFLWRWYESRPRPVEIEFTVAAPAITCYACEPQGDANPLIVRFAASVAPLERAGHPIADNTVTAPGDAAPADAAPSGISMKPDFAGQWIWDDDKTLRFQPGADWPIGEIFEVSFSRRHFAADQVRLKGYEFEFSTAPFEAQLASTEFHQDPVVVGNKKVVANIAFTHPVDQESFDKRVRLKMFDRVTDSIEKELTAPAHTIVYDKLKLNAYVHSAQLDVPPKAGRLLITIEPGVRAARGGNDTKDQLNTSVEVPGLNSLTVARLSLDIVRDERNEPDQVLLINTSFSVPERDFPPKVNAWLLPQQHPDPKLQAEFERHGRGQPFAWNEANFRPEVLNADTKLDLAQIPGEREHYELHSFRYAADPGRHLYVKVDAGLKSFGGYVLGDAVEQIVQVPEFPRELSILHQGSLLAMSGEKTLTLFARNVPAMRIEVGRLLPRQLQHLVTQTNGSFATPQFNSWAFDAVNITERFTKVVRLPAVEPGKAQYEALDLGEYLNEEAADRRGIFLMRVQAWNADSDSALDYAPDEWNATRQSSLADARLLVVTDLGLVVKRSVDGSQDVFVQSIATGAPVAGASVEIIGRNGLPVLTETTDAQGHVRFPDLKSFQRERAAVLYLARHGGDSSFIPAAQGGDYRGRSLDLSRFDIGGAESSADRGALAAYIFSDRGIYRPGEELRAAALVRSQDWTQNFDGLPLRLEVTDPRGAIVRRETYVAGAAGFGEILHATQESSPTGTYTLALSIVRNQYNADLIGSTTVQVRDFLPDRLRMKAGFSAESADGWVSPDDLEARLRLENLFGTPAENRRITAQLILSPSIPAFRAFPDYRFHDPQYAREGFSEQLAEAKTDEEGNATLALNLQRFARATYRLHLIAQGFEADGGRGVTSEAAQLVSSMPYLIGYKADGDLGYLSRDGSRSVHLVAINPQAQRTRVDDLTLARVEIRYVSVLMRQPNGTYNWRWFRTTTTSSVQRIKLPAGLEGNAYVAVTFVRDAGSSEIYTSPMSYGVQPFSIDVGARRNAVSIEAPSLVKPGEEVTFRYRTETPSRLVLFAVDEGILQVANYKTPNPLGHFFQKRALEVSTTQILDLILPEFRHLGLAVAPGGDAEGLLGKHLNPFRRKGEKPVAYWSGIVDADSTARELKYTVPDYFNGTLRVMAVAVADDRVGVHDSRTLVRGDFVLSPNAPTTVTPGDEFDVSVGVSNNVQGSGANANITIALETDGGLEVIGDTRQRATIAEGREGSVRFRLRARDEIGPANLTFTASTGTASGRRRIDLSIRPATPYMTQLKAGVLDRGNREVRIERTLYPHHRELETGISALPLQFAHGFVSYLANYPYACTEQIVSQAMPAVLLTSRPEFGYVRTEPGADIAGLISELRARQNDAGAYKLWPGGEQVVEFVSLYAQHLLLEAVERGEAIPADLTGNGNNYLRAVAERDGNNLTDERQSAYAIYLLIRQGQRMSAEIVAARKRLEERYRGQWEQDLTAAWLAAALDLMRQDRDAERIVTRLRFASATSSETYNDPMTRDALLLFVIARHFPERLPAIPGDVLATLAQRVTDGYYHSLSAGTTLLALDAYANAAQGTARNLSIAEVLKSQRARALTLPQGSFPKTSFTDQAAALRFGNNSNLNAYYSIEQSGFDRTPPTESIRQGLEVLREYTDAGGKPLTRITLGQQIDVHLKFRGLKGDFIDSIALVDLLPGGFELVVPAQEAQTPFTETAGNEGDVGLESAFSGWQCQICVGNTKAMLQYADMREDRVVFYVNANRDVSEIVYRIKATNVGEYVVPPAYGEAMYDRSVLARSASGRITVSRP